MSHPPNCEIKIRVWGAIGAERRFWVTVEGEVLEDL